MKYISFVVPCFNSEKYMEKCIDSLLMCGDDVEIIIVNDGSTDTTAEIAKNYLSEKELDLLNRMVSAYLDVAEINALNMHAMTMKEWVNELNGFLTMTHKDILEGAGTISHEKALEKAHKEYDKYMKSHLTQAEKDYLEIMGEDIKKLK